MREPSQPGRILETTRGRVLSLLRQRDGMTTDELARALGLTDNAVRAHLATLERDGFVQAQGERREGRVGKPATVYHIAPSAEPLFSRAYLPFLMSLLDALGDRLPAGELENVLSHAGNRLAGRLPQPTGDLGQRVHAVSRLLNELGGVTSVAEMEDAGKYIIQSRGCPVGLAVSEQPEVCEAMVGLLSNLTGAEVRSCCHREGRPRCCFEVEP